MARPSGDRGAAYRNWLRAREAAEYAVTLERAVHAAQAALSAGVPDGVRDTLLEMFVKWAHEAASRRPDWIDKRHRIR